MLARADVKVNIFQNRSGAAARSIRLVHAFEFDPHSVTTNSDTRRVNARPKVIITRVVPTR